MSGRFSQKRIRDNKGDAVALTKEQQHLLAFIIFSSCDGSYAIFFCVCASQSCVFFFFYRKA